MLYSLYGQDRLVVEILAGKTGGFFLDSGASDGLRCNDTALLERECGWNGICVEPNTEFFERLIQHRRCCCVNSCLSDQPGIVDFLDAGTVGGVVAEYDPAFLNQIHTALHGDVPAVVQKISHTIGTILEDLGAPTWINYWSLDTEGSELTILKSFPFDRYRPGHHSRTQLASRSIADPTVPSIKGLPMDSRTRMRRRVSPDRAPDVALAQRRLLPGTTCCGRRASASRMSTLGGSCLCDQHFGRIDTHYRRAAIAEGAGHGATSFYKLRAAVRGSSTPRGVEGNAGEVIRSFSRRSAGA
jgi:hypothetical protein